MHKEGPQTTKRIQSGFTLVEVLTVIAIIGLVMLIVLPSVGKLFSSEADSQARNLIDAQLKAARSLAVRDRTYTGVHFQRDLRDGQFWTALVQVSSEDPSDPDFTDNWASLTGNPGVLLSTGETMRVVPGTPAKLPGGVGVGVVHAGLGDNYGNLKQWIDNCGGEDRVFTTFTVLFDPDGRIVTPTSPWAFVRQVGGVYYSSFAFSDVSRDEELRIWELQPEDDVYVKAVCVFDSGVLDSLPLEGAGVTKATYLDENAQFLPVAPYVGGLIRTATD